MSLSAVSYSVLMPQAVGIQWEKAYSVVCDLCSGAEYFWSSAAPRALSEGSRWLQP